MSKTSGNGSLAAQSPPSLRLPAAVQERNMRYGLVQAAFWAIMFGSGELYFGLFATHLDLGTYGFALLSGLPMILGPLAQVVSANLLARYPDRRWMVLSIILVQMLCFLPVMGLTFFFPGKAAWVILTAAVLIHAVAGNFGAPAWNSWISDSVPGAMRADYFARQGRIVSLMTLIAQLAVAGLLYLAENKSASPANRIALVFCLAFAVALAARGASFVYVRRMIEPGYSAPPESAFTFWQFIKRAQESNFVKFVCFAAVFHFGAFLSGPFFLPYVRYELKYEHWQWVVLSSSAVLSTVAGLGFWARFSNRFGNKQSMAITGYLVAIVPWMWLFSPNFYYLTAVNLFSGAVWCGFGLSMGNYILEAVSSPKRPRCFAYFSILVGAGCSLGALLGGFLKSRMPEFALPGMWWAPAAENVYSSFVYLLLLSGLLRLLSCVFLLPAFRELREVHPLSLGEVVWQIAGPFNQVGAWLGLVSAQRDDEANGAKPSAGTQTDRLAQGGSA
jgi:MFS family permease